MKKSNNRTNILARHDEELNKLSAISEECHNSSLYVVSNARFPHNAIAEHHSKLHHAQMMSTLLIVILTTAKAVCFFCTQLSYVIPASVSRASE